MEYDKYYDIKQDGAYVLHFPNNAGLTLNDIEKQFSAYGNVLSVDNRGQPFGLCFIKYNNLEDSMRCIEGFQNHAQIKILPHKKKLQMHNANKRLSIQGKGILNQSLPAHGLDDRSKDIDKSIFTKKRYSYDQREQRSDSCESRSLFSNNDKGFKNDTVDNESCSDNSIISSRRSSNKTSSLRHFVKQKVLQKTASSTSLSSGAAEDNTKRREEIIHRNEIPPLVCSDQRRADCNKRFSMLTSAIIPAEEVIVANIHPSIGIHYILHLFEKYNPISVSLMMTIPKTGIKYCHVYFKSSTEAVATETEFDMCLLRGNNLIVLRSQKLTQEALVL